jgi:hypothetical protein
MTPKAVQGWCELQRPQAHTRMRRAHGRVRSNANAATTRLSNACGRKTGRPEGNKRPHGNLCFGRSTRTRPPTKTAGQRDRRGGATKGLRTMHGNQSDSIGRHGPALARRWHSMALARHGTVIAWHGMPCVHCGHRRELLARGKARNVPAIGRESMARRGILSPPEETPIASPSAQRV